MYQAYVWWKQWRRTAMMDFKSKFHPHSIIALPKGLTYKWYPLYDGEEYISKTDVIGSMWKHSSSFYLGNFTFKRDHRWLWKELPINYLHIKRHTWSHHNHINKEILQVKYQILQTCHWQPSNNIKVPFNTWRQSMNLEQTKLYTTEEISLGQLMMTICWWWRSIKRLPTSKDLFTVKATKYLGPYKFFYMKENFFRHLRRRPRQRYKYAWLHGKDVPG